MNIRIGDLVIGAGPGSRQQALNLAAAYLTEREKTKRLLIGAVCLFLIIAALLVVFAPEQRDTLAYACGATLVVMALGAIGVSRFILSFPGIIEIKASDEDASATETTNSAE